MTIGILESTGHALASHNLGPRAALHMSLLVRNSNSFSSFGKFLTPLQGTKAKSKKSGSVGLRGFVVSTLLPSFIFIRPWMKTKNQFEVCYSVSSESEYVGPFHGPKSDCSCCEKSGGRGNFSSFPKTIRE